MVVPTSSPGHKPIGRFGLAAASLLAGVALTGCSPVAVASHQPHHHAAAPPSTASSTTSSTTSTVPVTTTTIDQSGWNMLGTDQNGIALDERTIVGPSGAQVTLVRFRRGAVRFALHVGSSDPPTGSAPVPPSAGSSISATEAPLLLAAFNGGFKIATDVGGFEVDGETLSPLVPGMASLVIDANGMATIGVWGQSVPKAGESVVSVRQNLPPLILQDTISAQIADIAAWGATIGPAAVARSALGEDLAGNLIYAASASALPIDLATALLDAGAVTAMQLDINPDWVQLDAAPDPGGPLSAIIPGQYPPADQYQRGWTRDFITVLAA